MLRVEDEHYESFITISARFLFLFSNSTKKIKLMEVNKIYNENCLDTMARMKDNFIDLTVTSPPYDNLREYNGYSFDFESIAKELYRTTKEGGVLVWVVSDATIKGNETGTSFKQALYFKEVGFNLHDTMIYFINGTGAKGSNLAYWQSFEYMFVFTKGKPNTVNRIADKKNSNAGKKRCSYGSKKLNEIGTRKERKGVVSPEFSIRDNVWKYNVGKNDKTNHPAVFPEKLVRDHICSWTNENDLVYDCFMGSGTTAKMAHIYKRNWIGSELSKEYLKDAENRLKPHLTQMILF
jgi:site-specific DNA-methyltransferase (adenine-specific)